MPQNAARNGIGKYGNKELTEDKEMLLIMLQASVVLEYNGKRWHNLHPLIVLFFREQGLIRDVGE